MVHVIEVQADIDIETEDNTIDNMERDAETMNNTLFESIKELPDYMDNSVLLETIVHGDEDDSRQAFKEFMAQYIPVQVNKVQLPIVNKQALLSARQKQLAIMAVSDGHFMLFDGKKPVARFNKQTSICH